MIGRLFQEEEQRRLYMRNNFGQEYGYFSRLLAIIELIERHFLKYLNRFINFLGILIYQQYIGLEFLFSDHLLKKIIYTDFQQICVNFLM